MSDSRLAEAAHPAFARHETFAPRFGWLHKAYMQVKDRPDTFLADDAPVLLGVGKNMAIAMRYWSKAFKLTRETYGDDSNSRAMFSYPTWEARWLLAEDGADPYLEEQGSLWLLHWWLLCSRPGAMSWAPSWYVAFQLAPFARFSARDLTQLIVRHVNLSYKDAPVEASIGKDVDCITKMYVPAKRAKGGAPGALEDLLGGPFRELGLMAAVDHPTSGRPEWEFTTGSRISLPDRVVAYACLDYAARTTRSAGSISLARLANEHGAPGRAFRVREPDIAAALERVAATTAGLQVAEAVGQRSLAFDSDPFELAWDVLDAQYDNVRDRPDFPTRLQWDLQYPKLAEAAARELKLQDVTEPTLALIEETP
ncbi:DUF4007 family protein [Kitasatospora xanthocidica]|uniref:DUF4007 family protein n=1 Tax=Kitasatospora xanthocidica TaxID=83382 RepID=A0A372ZWR8_9ACTN|nr:DUF4007 family protein [Kitasatospora xanthocidica]RGD60306.1 DUF4007 family protein [Kitasatospora xanthocidica]